MCGITIINHGRIMDSIRRVRIIMLTIRVHIRNTMHTPLIIHSRSRARIRASLMCLA